MLTNSVIRQRTENALQDTILTSGPDSQPKALPKPPLALVIVQTGAFRYQVCEHALDMGHDAYRPLSDPLSLASAQRWARIYRANN